MPSPNRHPGIPVPNSPHTPQRTSPKEKLLCLFGSIDSNQNFGVGGEMWSGVWFMYRDVLPWGSFENMRLHAVLLWLLLFVFSSCLLRCSSVCVFYLSRIFYLKKEVTVKTVGHSPAIYCVVLRNTFSHFLSVVVSGVRAVLPDWMTWLEVCFCN